MKRIVITPDIQVPFHVPRMVRAHIDFIRDWKPDLVVNIGDLTDFPAPSRWSKGRREEFAGSVEKDVETTKRVYFHPLRRVYDGPIVCHIGNHDLRPLQYLDDYAPALKSEDPKNSPFYYGNLLDFDGFGVEDPGDFYKVAPGWESTHGHRVAASLSRNPGLTALNEARKRGNSIVMGHTHKLAAVPETTGVGPNRKQVWGMEVGCFMDTTKASYLDKKGGWANWQHGFGVLYVDGNRVTPVAVPVNKDGSFVFEGRNWK